MPRADLREFVINAARRLGFDLAGIAPVREFGELDYFPRWIAEKRHGEMRYLEAQDDAGHLKRASIANVAPWARSIIVCALNYNTDQPFSIDTSSSSENSSGWISRYAWGQRDYHDLILPRLRQLEAQLRDAAVAEDPAADFRSWCYVDTGPIVERVAAKYAGIGWTGKNTCIINEQLGSWLFLGVILTSLELQPGLPAADRCGTCTRCLDACPTDAFIEPHRLDASRCISYLTIEKRGEIPQDLRAGMGRHVFGCDICQDVCPWNGSVRPELRATKSGMSDDSERGEQEFQPREKLINPDLEWLAAITEQDFRETFRGSPIKRAKRTGIRRNAVIAIGNSRDPRFRETLRHIAEEDPDVTVAEHARWALAQLDK